MTDQDIEIASELVLKGLMQNGFKPVSEEKFNEKLQAIFGLTSASKTKEIIQHKNFFVYLIDDGWSDDLKDTEYDYTYDHLFFITNHHILTTLPLVNDFVKKLDNGDIKICLPEITIHRNKYLFNDDKFSLVWLLNNDLFFLEQLVRTFGYDKEPKVNRAVLQKIAKEYQASSDPQALENLFATKNSEGKLQIREGLLKTVRDSYVNDETIFDQESNSDKTAFYTLVDAYRKGLLDQKSGDNFAFEERCHIVAAILNVMYDCLQTPGGLPDMEHLWMYESYPTEIDTIVKHKYFGYSNLKTYIEMLQAYILESKAKEKVQREEEAYGNEAVE
jgi:hypothetical protein